MTWLGGVLDNVAILMYVISLNCVQIWKLGSHNPLCGFPAKILWLSAVQLLYHTVMQVTEDAIGLS